MACAAESVLSWAEYLDCCPSVCWTEITTSLERYAILATIGDARSVCALYYGKNSDTLTAIDSPASSAVRTTPADAMMSSSISYVKTKRSTLKAVPDRAMPRTRPAIASTLGKREDQN